MQIEFRIYGNNGFSISPTSVVLESPDGSFGVRRTDTNYVVVPAGTPLVFSGGVWRYSFQEMEPGIEYEYYVKVSEDSPAENKYYVYGKRTGGGAQEGTLGWCVWLLCQLTGRYDLIRDPEAGDYSDAGLAVFYINSAQRMLDDQIRHHKSAARLFKQVPANSGMVTFQLARAVKNVYEFKDGVLTPVPWATYACALAPEHREETEETMPEVSGVAVYGLHFPTRSVWIQPKGADRTVCVEAEWYNAPMKNYSDRSFWTMQYPDVLVRAAAMELEVDLRNSTGRNDYYEYIQMRLKMIQQNYDAELAAGPADYWVMRA